MKRILLLISICMVIQVYGQGYQSIELSKSEMKLGELIAIISDQTNYTFSYTNQIDLDRRFILFETNYDLTELLQLITDQTGLESDIRRKDKIILYRNGPDQATISGFIKDINSGEALIGAAVYDEKSKKGTVANKYGFYSLTIPKQEVMMYCSYIGYDMELAKFYLTKDTVLSMELKENLLLEEVIVEAEKEYKINETTQISTVRIPIRQIQSMPAFNGEVDVLKSIQMLPGVKSGDEGNAGIYVRGGGQDENLILVDGVPVYNATHLYGFYSIFNPDAINSLTILKGGFPARYGGRTSSVLDITMKEGNLHEFHGLASVGLITAKGMLEGPIIKDRMSFMASGRTSHFDPFLGSGFSKGRSEDVDGDGFQFYDLNFKVNYKLNKRNRIFLSGYFGEDQSSTARNYQLDDSTGYYKQDIYSGIEWGNKISSLRWYHVLTKKIFSNLSMSFNEYRFTVTDDNSRISGNSRASADTTIIKSQYESGIRDLTLDYLIEFTPNPNHEIRFGIQGIYHTFSPGIKVNYDSFSEEEEEIQDEKINPTEYSIFLENDFTITPRIKSNIGLRFNEYRVRSKSYLTIQPRASFLYKLSNDVSLKSSYSMMQQNVHLLTNAGIGLPTDLWLPATENAPPIQSHQFVVGAASAFKENLELSAEVYYKTTSGLIEYQNGASYLESDENWEQLIERGHGESYGLELMLQKKEGRLNGWIGYTLSWTNRQFDNLNNGEWFPYRYDSRHDFKIVGVFQFNERLNLSGNWVFRTGNAVTVPTGAYQLGWMLESFNDHRELLEYTERNNLRMRNYHRLDISANYERGFRRLIHKVSISAYNLYDRKNPYFLEFGFRQNIGKVLKQESLFGIVPSITYSIKF